MKTITETLSAPRRFEESTRLLGTVSGNASIAPEVHFELDGTVTGDLTVERGAHAVIRGMVTGKLINLGGEVTVAGRVGSVIDTDPAHRTTLEPSAHVNGTAA
ncbi:hypothetical protein [Kaustia mangrovi]|uniref:hypothetical protein n=1 Tax=Kaustia mangrovi TaxID=2593653 RepID=UPI001FE52C46|nr:hypothetical protein [Kaustia mangrovi]